MITEKSQGKHLFIIVNYTPHLAIKSHFNHLNEVIVRLNQFFEVPPLIVLGDFNCSHWIEQIQYRTVVQDNKLVRTLVCDDMISCPHLKMILGNGLTTSMENVDCTRI